MSAPAKGSRPCPYCGRKGASCWVMPCLGLETVMAHGIDEINEWLRKVNAPFTVAASEHPDGAR